MSMLKYQNLTKYRLEEVSGGGRDLHVVAVHLEEVRALKQRAHRALAGCDPLRTGKSRVNI